MKTAQLSPIRIEPHIKQYIERAAAADRRSVSSFMVHAALLYADGLCSKGWSAKAPPVPRDGRRKAVAA